MKEDTFEENREEFYRRIAHAEAMGGPEKLQYRRDNGWLNARERLELLFDKNSFTEIGKLARSVNSEQREKTPADGKLCGVGRVEKRLVAAVSNDLTVMGASSSFINTSKIGYIKSIATRNGMPLVFFGESSGSRIEDTMGAGQMGRGGMDPQQYLRLRETPWVSAVLGPCFGSSSWYACLSDFVVMRKGSCMAASSDRVTSKAIDQVVVYGLTF